MAQVSYKQQIIERVEKLNTNDQLKVLEFLQNIENVIEGVPGTSLLRFVGSIPSDDLDRMAQAIEEDCDKVVVPSVVLGELYYGAYRSDRLEENLKVIEDFANSNKILDCNMMTAKSTGQSSSS